MGQILLIEPDRILARVYKKALEESGYTVKLAAGAQSAILIADKINPDLVIVELQLVEHSGIEFLYEFRSYPEWQATSVVLLTNVPPGEFASSSTILRKELGISAYLYKPYTSLNNLVKQVKELIPLSLRV